LNNCPCGKQPNATILPDGRQCVYCGDSTPEYTHYYEIEAPTLALAIEQWNITFPENIGKKDRKYHVE
jgi:hypothetical protein